MCVFISYVWLNPQKKMDQTQRGSCWWSNRFFNQQIGNISKGASWVIFSESHYCFSGTVSPTVKKIGINYACDCVPSNTVDNKIVYIASSHLLPRIHHHKYSTNLGGPQLVP